MKVLIVREPHDCEDHLPDQRFHGEGALARCDCGDHYRIKDGRWRWVSRRKAKSMIQRERRNRAE